MKTTKAMVFALIVAASRLWAADYYVDASRPDDSGDGLSAATAKRTLAAAAALATESGDVIHAAPGDYDEGAQWDNSQSNRVIVAEGVSLVSDCGAAHTFITGAEAPELADIYGCGDNATRCVYLNSDAKLVGFTLRGGRTTASTRGGGVHGAATSFVSDCFITNCVAESGGGTAGIGYSIRNRYIDCRATSNEGGAHRGGEAVVNCFFDRIYSSYDIYAAKLIMNCTFGSNGCRGIRGTFGQTRAINCLQLCHSYSKPGCEYLNCIFAYKPQGTEGTNWRTNGACRVVGDLAFEIDSTGAPVIGSSPAINAGDGALYAGNYPATMDGKAAYDLTGSFRTIGTAIDCGAVEAELLYEFSDALAPGRTKLGLPSRARVMSVSSGTTPGDGVLTLPAGCETEIVWKPVQTVSRPVQRAFFVTTDAETSVCVYLDGSDTPAWTIEPSSVNVKISHTALHQTQLKFVCAGSGTASLHGFSDSAIVTFEDANGAVTVEGLGSNPTELFLGEGFELGFSRKYTSKMLCTGISLNGDFVSFNDHDDGWVWNFSADSTSAADVFDFRAVYAVTNDWYVDAAVGDDGNDGYRPGSAHAFKTIRAAMANPDLADGDIVHVAAGDYCTDEVFDNGQTNRVVVPEGVTLVADQGRDVTFITGKASERGDAVYGCASDSIRCVTLRNRAKISGFTLRSGRGNGTTRGGGVGGVDEDTVVSDCIITNCAALRGGGVNNIALSVRNRYFDCRATESIGAASAGGGTFINCTVDRSFGSYDLYVPECVANCTFGADSCGGPNGNTDVSAKFIPVINCVFLKNPYGEGCAYRNCIWSAAPSRASHSADERCSLVVNPRLGKSLRPKSTGSAVVNIGDLAEYEAVYPVSLDGGIALDVDKRPRVSYGQIDLGAAEYSWERGLYFILR